MGNLSKVVKMHYDSEARAIKQAGSLWPLGIILAIVLVLTWAFDFLFAKPWNREEAGWTVIGYFVFLLVDREWDRYKAAAKIRHEREIRMEMKLGVLLGIVHAANLNDD